MEKYKPTKMKVDIEGSEWEVLINCTDFGDVDQIIFEYNFDMNMDLKEDFKRFKALRKHLKKHGFDVSEIETNMKKQMASTLNNSGFSLVSSRAAPTK